MTRLWLICGATLAGVAVAAGSFGAHALKGILEANAQAANWETAVRYCLFHAIALLIVGLALALPQPAFGRSMLTAAGLCFLVGTLVFSGCLASLALSGIKILGAIVPIGGALMLLGWACLAIAGYQLDSR